MKPPSIDWVADQAAFRISQVFFGNHCIHSPLILKEKDRLLLQYPQDKKAGFGNRK